MTWREILTKYVDRQRERVCANYAMFTAERDGLLDGLIVLEWTVNSGDLDNLTYTIVRRLKAEESMRAEGLHHWGFVTYRRIRCTTVQLMVGFDLAALASGVADEKGVDARALLAYRELRASIEKEGKGQQA